jgi:hypothetical protein
VVGHAGARLLADVAEATGLVREFSDAFAPMRQRASGHDPGRVAVDLAVMLADGGEAIADLAVLRDQPDLFGPVASDATAWRVLAGIDEQALAALRQARAAVRETAWAQAAQTRGGLPSSTAAGVAIDGLVLDVDASIVVCHSEKESAAATWKRTFGYHPLFCFLDATREALAAILRPGNAGSNTTADHITVLDQALMQIPDVHRYGTSILVAQTPLVAPTGSWPTSAGCASTASTPASRSGSPSTSRSAPRSARCRPRRGSQRSTPTVKFATARRSPRSPTWSTCPATPKAPG